MTCFFYSTNGKMYWHIIAKTNSTVGHVNFAGIQIMGFGARCCEKHPTGKTPLLYLLVSKLCLQCSLTAFHSAELCQASVAPLHKRLALFETVPHGAGTPIGEGQKAFLQTK